MLALPVLAHSTTSKDSPAAMSGPGEWPSLGGPAPDTSGEGDDWEMLSPIDSGDVATNGEDVVVIPNRCSLTRKNSVSAPDLRELDVTVDEDQDISILNHDDAQTDVSSSVVMVSSPPSVASSSVVVVNNPWGAKNKVSFKDAIMSPSKLAPVTPRGNAPKPRIKNKVKVRYVVTPIKRCAKSTGDLLALAEDDDDDGPMGAEDAEEYYNRKAHGAHGRSNGLKQRPDEAKRKQMIVQKKNAQRQQGKP